MVVAYWSVDTPICNLQKDLVWIREHCSNYVVNVQNTWLWKRTLIQKVLIFGIVDQVELARWLIAITGITKIEPPRFNAISWLCLLKVTWLGWGRGWEGGQHGNAPWSGGWRAPNEYGFSVTIFLLQVIRKDRRLLILFFAMFMKSFRK